MNLNWALPFVAITSSWNQYKTKIKLNFTRKCFGHPHWVVISRSLVRCVTEKVLLLMSLWPGAQVPPPPVPPRWLCQCPGNVLISGHPQFRPGDSLGDIMKIIATLLILGVASFCLATNDYNETTPREKSMIAKRGFFLFFKLSIIVRTPVPVQHCPVPQWRVHHHGCQREYGCVHHLLRVLHRERYCGGQMCFWLWRWDVANRT